MNIIGPGNPSSLYPISYDVALIAADTQGKHGGLHGSSVNTEHLPTASLVNMGKRSRSAAIALLVYDHLISLDLEVFHIPQMPRHRIHLLDLRLTSFGDRGKAVLHSLFISSCIIYLMCNNMVTLITTLTVQAILQLRVYALYGRDPKILIFMLTLCVMEVGVMIVLAILTMTNLHGLPLKSTPTGCYYNGVLALSTLFWVPSLVYEPILFLLVAYKAWPMTSGHIGVPLVRRVARDSLLYFIIIFAELLANTIIWSRAITYINIVVPWSAALPSILGSRLMLNMREVVLTQGTGDSYILESFALSQTAYFDHFESGASTSNDGHVGEATNSGMAES
ncbi:hypothetical protein NLI96_g5545 [Meripilus lineatus]|uniref:Uncharacterized protein n=1 Tax=Meripilus lineatus TaxID=2056292 RepID=A0AAD5V2P9_9APHY|nr:hypothetical protein NLI96_g5545 [Physisporinus lineatus]